MIRKNLIPLFLVSLVFAACDSGINDEKYIEPQIEVQLIDLRETARSDKSQVERSAIQETWTVGLTVRNLESNEVISPPTITADNQTQNDVRFNLALSADSLYEFEVSFRQAGQLSGRGLVHHYITPSTSTVTIPAYLTDSSNPALVFEPSLINKPTNISSGDTEINMVYLGTDRPVEGLAAKLELTGIDETLLVVEGPNTVLESGIINLIWNWSDNPADGTARSVGTVTYPQGTTTSFCLDVEEGNARVVHSDATISRQTVRSEACVEFGN